MKDKVVEETSPVAATATNPRPYETWRDTWVGALVRDPKQIPATRLVVGYVADSPDSGLVRIFFDAQLCTAVDVPEDGILHREAIPRSVSPLGGSYLWVDEKAWPRVVSLARCY